MQNILDIGDILSIFHPDAFFKGKLFIQTITETRNITFQRNSFKILKSLRLNHATQIFIDTKFEELTISHGQLLINFRYENGALDWRMQGCDEQSMIGAGCSSNNRTRGIAPQTIGNQPFKIESCLH